MAAVALLVTATFAPGGAHAGKRKRTIRRIQRLARSKTLTHLAPPSNGWVTAGGVIVDPKTHKILLVRNAKEKRQGTNGWTWPKGKVDPGESPAKTAKRESREESGVVAGVGPHLLTLQTKRANRAYFLMYKKQDKGDYDRHETLEVRWVTPKQARKMLDRGRDRSVLKAAAKVLEQLK